MNRRSLLLGLLSMPLAFIGLRSAVETKKPNLINRRGDAKLNTALDDFYIEADKIRFRRGDLMVVGGYDTKPMQIAWSTPWDSSAWTAS